MFLERLLAIAVVVGLVFGIHYYMRLLREEPKRGHTPKPVSQNLHRSLFLKLARLSPESELDLFLIARTKMKMPVSDEVVKRDYEKYLETQDLPSYVVSFVEQGMNKILEA